MFIKAMNEDLSNKIEEMELTLDELLKSNVSENTKRTQKYLRTKDIRTLKVMKVFLERLQECNGYDDLGKDGNNVMSEEQYKWFESITTLTSERKNKYVVEVNEGDHVMELLQKYASVKDVYQKIVKACDAKGLMMKGNDIVRK